MTATALGRTDWGLSRDAEGHREYNISFYVETDDPEDGPFTVLQCAGLPNTGSLWGYGNDSDLWAFCWPTAKVKQLLTKEPNRFWEVDHTFSTKPLSRCQTDTIEDPLAEPQQIGGSFVNYMEKGVRDKDGELIETSSHEVINGPENEWDAGRPTVWVEQNISALGAPAMVAAIHTLNDATLWGLGPRKVKLSSISWTRKLYGSCTYYYTRRFEFDINFATFDRYIIDRGLNVIKGYWDGSGVWVPSGADANNPTNFQRFKDVLSENAGPVNLDGAGNPLTVGSAPVYLLIEKYAESNLLLLGIPTSL